MTGMFLSKPPGYAIEMRRWILPGVLSALLALSVALWLNGSSSGVKAFDPKVRPPESAPLCPWRDPVSDLKQFFPEATRHAVETRILSGQRLELAERLGRMPTGDENALHVWRVYAGVSLVGSVLTRRVKGEYGVIELVLAVEANGSVRGVRLQRLREPENIAQVLQNPNWLRSFKGRRADSLWKLGEDIPGVPAEVCASAMAMIEGARSLLILLAAGEQAISATNLAPGAHH
jgi:hypothetical protein